MKKLFDFLGLEYPSDIDLHIAEHTGILKDHKTVQIRKFGEGFNRNSEKNSLEWQKKLKKSEIDSIEASCETVMEKLGYTKYAKISTNFDHYLL